MLVEGRSGLRYCGASSSRVRLDARVRRAPVGTAVGRRPLGGLLYGMKTDMMPPEPAFARTSFPFDVTWRDIPSARGERTPTVGLTDDGLLLVVRFVFMIVVLVVEFRWLRRK